MYQNILFIDGYCSIVHIYHSLMGTWIISTFWLLWMMLLWPLVYKYLFESLFSILLDIYLGVELSFYVYLFEEPPKWFPQGLHHFAFPPAMYKCSNFSTSSPIFIFCFSNYIHLSSVRWYLFVVLTCISLMTNYVEHLFMYLLAIYISSLGQCLIKVPYLFLNWVTCLFLAEL